MCGGRACSDVPGRATKAAFLQVVFGDGCRRCKRRAGQLPFGAEAAAGTIGKCDRQRGQCTAEDYATRLGFNCIQGDTVQHVAWIRGLIVWAVLAGVGLWYLGHALQSRGSSPARMATQLWQYSVEPRTTAQLQMPEHTLLAVGDPVFVYEDGRPRRVGEVAEVRHHETGQPCHIAWVTTAEVTFYPDAPPLAGSVIRDHRTPGDFAWALRTFLPPEKRAAIASELTAAFEQHRDQIVTALRPVVQKGLSNAVAVIEEDLPAALAKHREQLQAIGARYQHNLVQEQVVPLVKQEILPLVQREAEPIATKIGQELWSRVSLVGFGWAYVLDRTPLLEKKNRVRTEWDEFVANDAMPVFEAHSDEIVAAVQRIIAQAMQNAKVQQVLKTGLAEMLHDEELQAVVWQIVREVMITNPKMHEVLDATLRSPEAQKAFRLTGEMLEPTVVRLGELMFGSRETGIAPEFAAVLRNRVLFKDRRWLVLEPAAEPPANSAQQSPLVLNVTPGDPDAPNPFILLMPEPASGEQPTP